MTQQKLYIHISSYAFATNCTKDSLKIKYWVYESYRKIPELIKKFMSEEKLDMIKKPSKVPELLSACREVWVDYIASSIVNDH